MRNSPHAPLVSVDNFGCHAMKHSRPRYATGWDLSELELHSEGERTDATKVELNIGKY